MPGPQPQQFQDAQDPQQQQPSPVAEQEERFHKFQPGPNWALVTRNNTSPGARETLLYVTPAKFDKLERKRLRTCQGTILMKQ